MQKQPSIAQRHLDENRQLLSRNLPYMPYQPHLDVYGTPTKYALFPQPTVMPQSTPLSTLGFNVSASSDLRGAMTPLQKCGVQFIPKAASALYLPTPIMGPRVTDTLLFEQPRFNPAGEQCHPELADVGRQLFLNNTRMQAKDAH